MTDIRVTNDEQNSAVLARIEELLERTLTVTESNDDASERIVQLLGDWLGTRLEPGERIP